MSIVKSILYTLLEAVGVPIKKKHKVSKKKRRKKVARKRRKATSSAKKKGVKKKRVATKKNPAKKKATKKKKILAVKRKVAKKKVVTRKNAAIKKRVVKKAKKAVKKRSDKEKKSTSVSDGRILVGEITHFFSNAQVGIIKITKIGLSSGEEIFFEGVTTKFKQKVKSMQINHIPVEDARVGEEIGLKVSKRVRVGDLVYKKTK